MSRWQSKAQLEEQANEAAKWQIIAAVKEQVAQLVATWNVSGYPELGECENALYVIIKSNDVFTALPKDIRYNARILAVQHFMDAGISKAAREKQRQRDKAEREAFQLASQGRVVVEKGMFRSSMIPGEIVIVGSKGEDQQVLTCLTCEFIHTPRDMGQDDDGYYVTLAEPTDEEKETEAFKQVAKKVANDLAYEQSQKQRFEARRQAELKAIQDSGRETGFFEDLFAGTSDN